jgi:predicted ester cyclase
VFTYPLSGEQFIGRAGYRELARRWVTAFPDGTVSIIMVRVSEGPTVRTDWVAHGTHLGPLDLPGLPPIPPTGIHTHLSMRETVRISHGLIVESRMEFDPDELRRRLSA